MVKNMIYRQVKGQILIKDDLRQHSHELNTENMIYCTMNSFEHKNLIQNIVLDCFILLQRIYKTLHSPADRFLLFLLYILSFYRPILILVVVHLTNFDLKLTQKSDKIDL